MRKSIFITLFSLTVFFGFLFGIVPKSSAQSAEQERVLSQEIRELREKTLANLKSQVTLEPDKLVELSLCMAHGGFYYSWNNFKWKQLADLKDKQEPYMSLYPIMLNEHCSNNFHPLTNETKSTGVTWCIDSKPVDGTIWNCPDYNTSYGEVNPAPKSFEEHFEKLRSNVNTLVKEGVNYAIKGVEGGIGTEGAGGPGSEATEKKSGFSGATGLQSGIWGQNATLKDNNKKKEFFDAAIHFNRANFCIIDPCHPLCALTSSSCLSSKRCIDSLLTVVLDPDKVIKSKNFKLFLPQDATGPNWESVGADNHTKEPYFLKSVTSYELTNLSVQQVAKAKMVLSYFHETNLARINKGACFQKFKEEIEISSNKYPDVDCKAHLKTEEIDAILEKLKNEGAKDIRKLKEFKDNFGTAKLCSKEPPAPTPPPTPTPEEKPEEKPEVKPEAKPEVKPKAELKDLSPQPSCGDENKKAKEGVQLAADCDTPMGSKYSNLCIGGGVALVAGGLWLLAKSQQHLKKAKEFAAMAKKFKTNQDWNNGILDKSKNNKGHGADNYAEHENRYNKLDVPACFPVPYDGCDNTAVKFTDGLAQNTATATGPGPFGVVPNQTAVPFARINAKGGLGSLNSASRFATMNSTVASAFPEVMGVRYGELSGSPASLLEDRYGAGATKIADAVLSSGLTLTPAQNQQLGSALGNLGFSSGDIAGAMGDIGKSMSGSSKEDLVSEEVPKPAAVAAATTRSQPTTSDDEAGAVRRPSIDDLFKKNVNEWKKKYGTTEQIVKAAVASEKDDLLYNISLRYISFRDTLKDLSLQNTLEFPWDKNLRKHVNRDQLSAQPATGKTSTAAGRKASSVQ